MKLSHLLFLLITTLFATGCSVSPQKPISLDTQFYNVKSEKIGLYLDTIPKANTYFPGASCLLCLAAAEIANSDLTEHVQGLPNSEVDISLNIVEEILKANGLEVVRVEQPINISELKKFSTDNELIPYARKDFRSLKSSLGVDKLVVIDINRLGIYRSYSAYLPTSDPLGYVAGNISVIDLSDNQYKLYEPVNIKTKVKGEWDEPNQFPGVTTAYFQSTEVLKEKVKTLFSK